MTDYMIEDVLKTVKPITQHPDYSEDYAYGIDDVKEMLKLAFQKGVAVGVLEVLKGEKDD